MAAPPASMSGRLDSKPLTVRAQPWQYALKGKSQRDAVMYKRILVPIDLADPDLAKPAVATALMMAAQVEGTIRFVNVLPLTPVMLAEYVPPDFEVQQRKAAEDALAIVVKETGLPSSRVSSIVRQGGVYQEILEEATSMQPDLIVMSSHRPQRHAVRTYFLGSNAGHVVRYAKCSVLVVRN
jgi:nucleotide-binding universal stress UspA family protein